MSAVQILQAKSILGEYFGEVTQRVGICLITKGYTPLRVIAQETSLNLEQVKKSLSILIQHGIVDFEWNKRGFVEYGADVNQMLLRARFPRYVYSAKVLYGDAAELMIEEILQHGQIEMSKVLDKVVERMNEALAGQETVSTKDIKEKFSSLAGTQFIHRCASLEEGEKKPSESIPALRIDERSQYSVPDIDLSGSRKRKHTEDETDPPSKRARQDGSNDSVPDAGILWKVNYDRFHQYLRDQAIVNAVARKIDKKSSEVVRTMLRLSEVKTAPKSPVSTAMSFHEIHQALPKESNVTRQMLEQYLNLLVEDSMDFIVKSGDSGGGMFAIHFKRAMECLCRAHVETVVQERFGSKCFRIFRLLITKKYLEQKQIEEFAMIPAKEAKELIYRLFGEHFISLKEVPKTPDHAPARTFYLFSVDLRAVSRMLLERAFKTMGNLITRREHETRDNKRLLDKQQRVEAIAASLEQSGADPSQRAEIEEMITPPERAQLSKVKHITNKLEQGEIQLDETIFIIQTYLDYAQMKL